MAKKPSERRNYEDEDMELNLTPMMNLISLLIPCLLISMVFVEIATINVTAPAIGSASDGDPPEKPGETADAATNANGNANGNDDARAAGEDTAEEAAAEEEARGEARMRRRLQRTWRQLYDLRVPILCVTAACQVHETAWFNAGGWMLLNTYDSNNDMQVTQDAAKISTPLSTHLACLHANHWDISFGSFPMTMTMGSRKLVHPFPKTAALSAMLALIDEIGLNGSS